MTTRTARFADMSESIRYSIGHQANKLRRFTARLEANTLVARLPAFGVITVQTSGNERR
jgi:hypothetical protein